MSKIWNRRIPTLFGFLLLLVGIGVTSYLTLTGVSFFGHASPDENPKEVRITNITDASFTITYITDASVIGSLSYGTDQTLGQLALDDRDQASGVPSQNFIHSITVRNLSPLTKYYYSVTSGNTKYLNRDSPFITVTGPKIITAPPTALPLAGSVQLPSGDKPVESIVYVSAQNAQTLSSLVKPNGIYIIPMNSMRTQTLSSYASFQNSSTLQLLIFGDNNTQSMVTLLNGKRNPIPKITLANNYDFTLDTAPIASNSAIPIGFPVFSLDTSIQPEPVIIAPIQNAKYSDPQPVMKGKATPNGTVQITIHSQVAITKTLNADQYGNWQFRPDTPLPPGQHTITITTKDQSGILQTIQQTFTIFASGTEVAEAATPSATPTTIITPTPTDTPMPSPTFTPTPTIAATPTPTLTITPSLTISPSVTITPTKQQKIPPTGNNSAITFGVITLATTLTGIVLFLVSSGFSL